MIRQHGRQDRSFHAMATILAGFLLYGCAGCNLLPREDLRALSQALRPPPETDVDEQAVIERIRTRTGVVEFEPADGFLTDPPPVPSWAIVFMKFLVDDD